MKTQRSTSFVVTLLGCLLMTGAASAATAPNLQRGVAAFDKRDYAIALRELNPLAEHGDPQAQYYVGLMHENGWGVKRSYEQAIPFFRKAADQGNAQAQFSLGYFYANGLGVLRDYAQAAKFYRLAADADVEDVLRAHGGAPAHLVSEVDVVVVPRLFLRPHGCRSNQG
jgi:TPR repeat protein